ncbi:alanine racemase [Candidatus Poribacteria bacterium]|nr:alanine racemase [Candidatus Poribacteria bacterium]
MSPINLKIMLTWVEIDLNAISHNINQIKAKVKAYNAGIMAIIKDNAYSHGAVNVAQTATNTGVNMLGVATVEEAVELRQAGIDHPILIICGILPGQAETVVKHDIAQTVCTLDTCKALSKAAEKCGKKARVHVKIDTGMNRIGVNYQNALDFIKSALAFPALTMEGIMSHYAVAETDRDFTELQLSRFKQTLSQLEDSGIRIPVKHTANSAAILRFPESYFNMVRPGLITYGLYPSKDHYGLDLKPALSFKTKIFYLKELPPGQDISYGRRYTTYKKTLVASIAAGYGHGYSRSLFNKGEVIIRGKRAAVIGTICMDQCLCDVTHIPGVSIGDEVVLIGKQDDQEITADEVAEKMDTISYEVLCRINPKISRIYVK